MFECLLKSPHKSLPHGLSLKPLSLNSSWFHPSTFAFSHAVDAFGLSQPASPAGKPPGHCNLMSLSQLLFAPAKTILRYRGTSIATTAICWVFGPCKGGHGERPPQPSPLPGTRGRARWAHQSPAPAMLSTSHLLFLPGPLKCLSPAARMLFPPVRSRLGCFSLG